MLHYHSDDINVLKRQKLQNEIPKCALWLGRFHNTFILHKLNNVLTIRDRILYHQLVSIQGKIFFTRQNIVIPTRLLLR